MRLSIELSTVFPQLHWRQQLGEVVEKCIAPLGGAIPSHIAVLRKQAKQYVCMITYATTGISGFTQYVRFESDVCVSMKEAISNTLSKLVDYMVGIDVFRESVLSKLGMQDEE